MKYFLCFLSLLITADFVFAQKDSLAFVNADWSVAKISKGVILKRASFTKSLFGSNQYISILEIKKNRHLNFDLAYETTVLRTTSDFGRSSQAKAAINGTFFDIANGGSVDYLRSNHSVVNENRLNKNGTRALHQKAAVVINNGKLGIQSWDGTEIWESKINAEDVMVSGPMLIQNNSPVHLDSVSFNLTRHPRSIIAKGKRNRTFLIVIDGRRELAAGMSLFEARDILRWLKYVDGINLDGGGSSTLWVDGQDFNGVVNYPSDNKKWDHEGQRKVANVILLKTDR